MGGIVRDVASIAVTAIGGAIGGPFGAAVGNVLFNTLVPPKTPDVANNSFDNSSNKGVAVGTPIWEIFGTFQRSGGDLIRCGLDSNGRRCGISQVTASGGNSHGSGHIGGGSGSSGAATESYLHSTFALCRGFTYIERLTQIDNKNGSRVLYDRWAGVDPAVYANLDVITPEIYDTYLAPAYDARGLVTTPVFGSVSGNLIGEISDQIRLWYGSEEQPVDSAETTWYPEGVSADRGITKVVFNSYGPLESGTSFQFLLRNGQTNVRQIISARLQLAGIPESRINLTSLGEELTDFGWFVDSKQPARQLPELIAAKHFHDLCFMPTEAGAAFTDLSRANPTYIVVEDNLVGTYMNNDGAGAQPASSSNQITGRDNPPRELSVTFFDKSLDYANNDGMAQWDAAIGAPQQINLPYVGELQEVVDVAEVTMNELQSARGSVSVTLMPSLSIVAPGCVLIVSERSESDPQGVRLLRVMKQPLHENDMIECQCVPYDPAAYGRHRPVESPSIVPPAVVVYPVPTILFIDNVCVMDAMVSQPYVLAVATVGRGLPFGGALVRTTSGAFDDVRILSRGTVGALKTTYAYDDDALYSFDYDTTLRVVLDDGALASADEDDVRERANILYLALAAGGGMYLSFVTATPVAPGGPVAVGTYDITGLMPGRFGSDNWRTFPTDTTKVIKITDELGNNDAGPVSVPISIAKLMVPFNYYTTALGDTSKQSGNISLTVQGYNQYSLAPCPGVAKDDDGAGGYIVVAFGRTRYVESNAAFWSAGIHVRWSDPLSFTIVLTDGPGGAVKDTRAVTSTDGMIQTTYTMAELTTIFGAVPAHLSGTITEASALGLSFVREFDTI